MRVGERWYRAIWVEDDGGTVAVIDQTLLPARFQVIRLETVDQAAHAIRSMQVRGAPLIGITAAHGVALAMRAAPSDAALDAAIATLGASRPTAVNLRWALDRMRRVLGAVPEPERAERAYAEAGMMAEEDVAMCRRLGEHGETLIRDAWRRAGGDRPVNVLTHCNAGWLATVDWGTALAPIYLAHDAGLPLHVWVDETRPRNQGLLTAWELGQHGVPHTLIVDSAGGLLMRRGRVDLCLVGTDRTTRAGDVANKVGTYLKALAAHDNDVPFYVAVPTSSIDWSLADGSAVPIEERAPSELGYDASLPVLNVGFDVTPARLVTGLITERGVCEASEAGLNRLFGESTVSKGEQA
jgi:methylthioribose-1-phosphate isomerase